ncbi:MAG: zinc-binding dehydrogenase [Alphaproteobacteria bacterium]|nr:zinc-binding dehydrogenase [Alphaproteobacteria bacterium]
MSGNRQILSTVTEAGEAILSIVENDIPTPGPDEVVVRIEASPINPSDMFPLLGFADYSKGKLISEGNQHKMVAPVPEGMLTPMKARIGQSLPVGNEGAGTIVAAGDNVKQMEGKLVSLVTGASYQQFVKVPAAMCLVHNEGTTAEEAASSFVNPLTALCFIETMRAEGHKAIVHTAAASNLGQMLLKLCLQDDIDLVCIIRSDEQAKILKDLGAKYVINSKDADFTSQLEDAIADTQASLAFDAIGAGDMADTLLAAMERAFSRSASGLNTYGSDQFKQVYVYGRLGMGQITLGQAYGMHWACGGYLLTPNLQKMGPEKLGAMQARVADEIKTTFASHITDTLSLLEAIDPANVARYMPKKTGEKYLVQPQKDI